MKSHISQKSRRIRKSDMRMLSALFTAYLMSGIQQKDTEKEPAKRAAACPRIQRDGVARVRYCGGQRDYLAGYSANV